MKVCQIFTLVGTRLCWRIYNKNKKHCVIKVRKTPHEIKMVQHFMKFSRVFAQNGRKAFAPDPVSTSLTPAGRVQSYFATRVEICILFLSHHIIAFCDVEWMLLRQFARVKNSDNIYPGCKKLTICFLHDPRIYQTFFRIMAIN